MRLRPLLSSRPFDTGSHDEAQRRILTAAPTLALVKDLRHRLTHDKAQDPVCVVANPGGVGEQEENASSRPKSNAATAAATTEKTTTIGGGWWLWWWWFWEWRRAVGFHSTKQVCCCHRVHAGHITYTHEGRGFHTPGWFKNRKETKTGYFVCAMSW